MYPIKFENLYFDKVWGGRDLAKFRDNLPEGPVGESWDVACHDNGMSVVSNGKFKGKSLQQLVVELGEKLIGSKINKEKFPLLIKLINAKESLSVQVHPDDAYAQRVEKETGKTECWYIVDAEPGAKLILGTKEGVTKEEFRKALEVGEVEELMNYVEVKAGEVYFVKSGLIHAIGAGATIAEIQQNSDTTYRVYDYGRPRELHIEKAMEVIDFNLKGIASKGIVYEEEAYSKKYYILCDKFSLEEYKVKTEVTEKSDEERFYIFTCVEGKGTIEAKGEALQIAMGDSIFIPATLGEYTLRGDFKLLKSYVPDMKKVEEEIIKLVRY